MRHRLNKPRTILPCRESFPLLFAASFLTTAAVLPVASQGAEAPIIHELSNYYPWHLGGIQTTIWGANLTGTSRVTFGGSPATSLEVLDDNTVTFLSPRQTPYAPFARGDVVLTAPGGQVTLAGAIQFAPAVGNGGQTVTVGQDWVVMIEAEVSAGPSPSITLKWPVERRATGYVISRKSRSANSWVQIGSVPQPADATSWTDLNVAVGQAYEYEVMRTSNIPVSEFSGPSVLTTLTGYGYIYSGIEVEPADHRGTVILVVDNTVAGPCATELSTFQNDLIGDGWSVIRHDVPRGSLTSLTGPVSYEATGAPAVKNLIRSAYLADPKEVKAVILFGHVPVPYSGNYAATGHSPDHKGAFPSDVYYGDMDGVWTDNVVNVQESKDKWFSCWNIPGDGKFDQSFVPSRVELEVGRIDLWGMGDEIALLKQYLRKNHNHRHAQRVWPRRALIEEDSSSSLERSRSGWGSWPPLVGAGNVVKGTLGANVLARGEEYLGYCLIGGGDNDRSGNVFTTHWLYENPQVAFVMTWGSHHGDWDHPANFLRAPLASATGGLTSMYAWWPTCYLHPLGLGGTFGEVIRLRQNNATTYKPFDRYVGGVHIALMGDPTLRLFAVRPPSSMTIGADSGGHPVLSWEASTDSPLLGYHIYRGVDEKGSFKRLTFNPVIQTTWTDDGVTSGTFTYQVKAAKLETTASGTFVNMSQAIADTITVGINTAGTLEFRRSTYSQDEGASPVRITVSRSGGTSGEVSVSYGTDGGTATPGSDYTDVQGTLIWVAGDSSPKSFTVPVLDDSSVEPDETINLRLSFPSGGAALGTSVARLTVVNDDGPGTIYQVEPAAVWEGDDGITNLTITCLRQGGSTGNVDLNYATVPFGQGRQLQPGGSTVSAIVGIDYEPARGTLKWADGDSAPKSFEIEIHGNLKQERIKFITIRYDAPGGVAVHHSETGCNYIFNDDGPRILDIRWEDAGRLRLRVGATAHQALRLQVSTNLLIWQTQDSLLPGSTGEVDHILALDAAGSERFFRLVQP